jgi:hypothetical protein
VYRHPIYIPSSFGVTGQRKETAMRRAQLHTLVADLVTESFGGRDVDVADAVLADRDDDHGAFALLCRRLVDAGGEAEDGIRTAWAQLAAEVDDYTKDRVADGTIGQPALYLAAFL